jgi:TolB protein
VEVATGELRQLSSDPGMEINPSYSPDGRRIAFQSDRSGRLELWVANADGGEARQLTEEGVIGHFQRWLAGGTILYRCICGGRNVVRAIAADGGAPRDLPWVTGGSHLSLSPDGRRALDVVDHKALWLSPLAGGESRKVFEFADAADRIDYPVWSPGGGEVLFDRFRPEDGDLWLLEPQP